MVLFGMSSSIVSVRLIRSVGSLGAGILTDQAESGGELIAGILIETFRDLESLSAGYWRPASFVGTFSAGPGSRRFFRDFRELCTFSARSRDVQRRCRRCRSGLASAVSQPGLDPFVNDEAFAHSGVETSEVLDAEGGWSRALASRDGRSRTFRFPGVGGWLAEDSGVETSEVLDSEDDWSRTLAHY